MSVGEGVRGLAVVCECTHRLPVADADIGRRVVCACGRTVVVPLLEEFLDRPVLLSAPTVEGRIQRLLEQRLLPVVAGCVGCDDPRTTRVVEAEIECERARAHVDHGEGPWALILGLVALVAFQHILFVPFEAARGQTLGRDNSVYAPVCLCPECHHRLVEQRPRARRRKALIALGLLLAASVLAGFVNVFLGIGCAIVSLALVSWFVRRGRRRDQQSLKEMVTRVPAYRQLLKQYRSAVVLLPSAPPAGAE